MPSLNNSVVPVGAVAALGARRVVGSRLPVRFRRRWQRISESRLLVSQNQDDLHIVVKIFAKYIHQIFSRIMN